MTKTKVDVLIEKVDNLSLEVAETKGMMKVILNHLNVEEVIEEPLEEAIIGKGYLGIGSFEDFLKMLLNHSELQSEKLSVEDDSKHFFYNLNKILEDATKEISNLLEIFDNSFHPLYNNLEIIINEDYGMVIAIHKELSVNLDNGQKHWKTVSKGIAKCKLEDTFYDEIGILIAVSRLLDVPIDEKYLTIEQ